MSDNDNDNDDDHGHVFSSSVVARAIDSTDPWLIASIHEYLSDPGAAEVLAYEPSDDAKDYNFNNSPLVWKSSKQEVDRIVDRYLSGPSSGRIPRRNSARSADN